MVFKTDRLRFAGTSPLFKVGFPGYTETVERGRKRVAPAWAI